MKREVPPDVLEGLIPRNLLPCGDEASNVVSIDVAALLIGDGVHSGRCVEGEEREIVGFLVKQLERKC